MQSRDFVYWLQGYFEILDADRTRVQDLAPAQVDCIKRHLALVFKHEIDPAMGDEKHQTELNKIHGGSAVEVGKPSAGPVLYRC